MQSGWKYAALALALGVCACAAQRAHESGEGDRLGDDGGQQEPDAASVADLDARVGESARDASVDAAAAYTADATSLDARAADADMDAMSARDAHPFEANADAIDATDAARDLDADVRSEAGLDASAAAGNALDAAPDAAVDAQLDAAQDAQALDAEARTDAADGAYESGTPADAGSLPDASNACAPAALAACGPGATTCVRQGTSHVCTCSERYTRSSDATRCWRGRWSARELLRDTHEQASTEYIRLALNPAGDAVAVWYERGGNTEIWGSRYRPGTAWGPSTGWEQREGHEWAYDVAIDRERNVFVPRRSSGFQIGTDQILARRYPAEGPPDESLALSIAARSLRVLADPDGGATFFYSDRDLNVVSHRCSAQGVWAQPAAIEGSAVADEWLSASRDSVGNLFAGWIEYGDTGRVMASLRRPGQSWATPTPIGERGKLVTTELASAGDENALIVWVRQHTSTEQQVWASVHRKGLGWGAAASLGSTTNAFVRFSLAAIAADGSAFAAWTALGGQTTQMIVKRYTPQAGWSSTPDLSLPTGIDAGRLVMSPGGRAMVAWLGMTGLETRYYTPEDGWRDLLRIDDATAWANGFDLQMDAAGNAHLVWAGPYTVWTRRFEHASE